MEAHPATMTAREAHEAQAWDDDGGVHERCTAWVQRVIHVIDCPNTQHGERVYEELVATAGRGQQVLEIGCGDGEGTRTLLKYQPAHVLSLDISQRMIEIARGKVVDDRVEFSARSATQPLAERFNLIVGRAILHHLDYREFLARAYRDNLRPGGRMVFMEPMSHPFAIAFHRLVPSAHSPDERLLRPSDVAWMRRAFPWVALHGINLTSFPAGIVSSFLFASADNALTRAADRLDRRALARARGLATYSRLATIVIDKPA
jgi:SAM-dependent methyltransferase